VKGIGNYRFAERRSTSERRVGTLVSLQGDRASARFLDGQVFSFPAKLFEAASVRLGDKFALVTVYQGKRVVDVRVERNEARPGALLVAPLPKVQVKDNGKVTTRR